MFLKGALHYLLQTKSTASAIFELGYPKTSIRYLGIVLLFADILYLIPKTKFVGGLLLTGYLGGAVATHIIHKDPILNILLPVVLGILIWLSILLGNEKWQTIILFKSIT